MICFVTTCKGRTQHLRETLPKNLADNPNAKFVVLDYGSPDDLQSFISPYLVERWEGRLVLYRFPGARAFKMAHAKNMAHRCGIIEGADILVNLDADNLTGPHFDNYIEFYMGEKGKKVFLWGDMIKGVLPRGINGRIAVGVDAFLKSGGYDEKFETWGPDDKDFNQRLRLLGYHAHSIDSRFLDAVRHNDKMRFREYPEIRQSGGYYFSEDYKPDRCTAVANFGKVGCGVVYRNYDEAPYVIDPWPTRVFGIGLHKTATSSLHEAFKILHLEAAHWPSAHWAKAVWREMNDLGHSPTLEKHYAFSDLPFPLFYRQLDQAYPGSKFVLTIRNEEKWIASVRKHWDARRNPFRANWDNDPFSNRIHEVLYGRTDFDEATFRERYRRHNQEVMEYFRYRPHDLAILDMDNGGGWQELCRVIGSREPAVEYPRAVPGAI